MVATVFHPDLWGGVVCSFLFFTDALYLVLFVVGVFCSGLLVLLCPRTRYVVTSLAQSVHLRRFVLVGFFSLFSQQQSL